MAQLEVTGSDLCGRGRTEPERSPELLQSRELGMASQEAPGWRTNTACGMGPELELWLFAHSAHECVTLSESLVSLMLVVTNYT